MSIFIYEDDIEVAVLEKLAKPEFGYDIIKCSPDPDKRESLDDGTFRSSKKECVLPHILKSSLVKINPHIPESIIDEVIKSLAKDFSGQDLTAVNYDLYNKIRNQIKVVLFQSLTLSIFQYNNANPIFKNGNQTSHIEFPNSRDYDATPSKNYIF